MMTLNGMLDGTLLSVIAATLWVWLGYPMWMGRRFHGLLS